MSDPTSEEFYEDATAMLSELRQMQSDERIPNEVRIRVREIAVQLDIQIGQLTRAIADLTDAVTDAHMTWARDRSLDEEE